jgi:hypothetical protein
MISGWGILGDILRMGKGKLDPLSVNVEILESTTGSVNLKVKIGEYCECIVMMMASRSAVRADANLLLWIGRMAVRLSRLDGYDVYRAGIVISTLARFMGGKSREFVM